MTREEMRHLDIIHVQQSATQCEFDKVLAALRVLQSASRRVIEVRAKYLATHPDQRDYVEEEWVECIRDLMSQLPEEP